MFFSKICSLLNLPYEMTIKMTFEIFHQNSEVLIDSTIKMIQTIHTNHCNTLQHIATQCNTSTTPQTLAEEELQCASGETAGRHLLAPACCGLIQPQRVARTDGERQIVTAYAQNRHGGMSRWKESREYC